jgi:hypothetical protein
MEKTDGDQPSVITDLNHQRAPPTHCNGSASDIPLYDCIDLISEFADGRDASAVLIPKRKMKQQIFQRIDANF